MPSILKWVWKNAVELRLKSKTKQETVIIHETCFKILRKKNEKTKKWKILEI
jgi:hypothetical protein